ncbi:MAG: hypothetical protein OQL19_03005 [Gammaproteobacteria bacterium]|nr:hypothetical protein [Gammaproteobacteria bacterium]
MIKNNRMKLIFILLFTLFFINIVYADHDPIFNIKELKEAGKISSLETILGKLSPYGIHRILEVELEKNVIQTNDGQINYQYIYEIEYINNDGIVLEIEVDALTAQILDIEREH